MSEPGKREPERWGGVAAGPAGLAAGAILVALAWLLTGPLPWPERAYATFLLGALPAALLASGSPTSLPEDATRHGVYASSWGGLWVLTALAALVTLPGGRTGETLGLAWPGARLAAGWSVLLVLAGAGIVAAWYLAGHRESPISRFLLPRTAAEKVHFAWLALSAGFCEEVVFRGFLVHAVAAASDSLPLAVFVSAVVFGLAHRYQGASGALRAGVLGAALSGPVLVLGSVVPAIIAHAALDLLAGLWWRDRLWRETLVPPRSSI